MTIGTAVSILSIVSVAVGSALYVETRKADKVEVASAIQRVLVISDDREFKRYEELIEEAQKEKRKAKEEGNSGKAEEIKDRIEIYRGRQEKYK